MANRRFIDFPIASTVGDNDIVLIWQSGVNKQTTKATFLSGLPENLDELNDVAISGLTNGQILRYDSVTGKWENTDQGNLDLNDLNDVSIVSPSNGQVLVYNSSTSKWENSSGGYVPYTGAVTTVNLGAQTIQAGQFVKAGGTSSQFLKADGSIDSTAYGTGSVTSVALTMPSAFNVANSPVTTSGTLAVTGAGTVSQYIRGDGSLADFPESSGGGSSVSYYLNGSVNQGTIGGVAYKELSKVPVLGTGTDFTINADGYIASFLTDAGDPNLLEIPGGNWNFETYFSASSSGGTPTFYVELYKYDGSTFTLIASNSSAPEFIAFGTTLTSYFSTLAVPTTALALTDRLAIRYYVNHSGRTITLHTENNHLCQIITTFTTGLTALNGLTAQVQNFAVGTSGSDFNIASATATHTFNLPTASGTNRGALSSADWTTFNNKQNALGYVPVPETRTLTINGTAFDLSANRSWTVGDMLLNTYQVVTGSKIFGTNRLIMDGEGTAQPTSLSNTQTSNSALTSHNSFGFNGSNNIYFNKGTTANGGIFAFSNTATRTYTLKDASGTLAFTSDIPANPVGGTGTTNYLPKFTGSTTIGNSNLVDISGYLVLGNNSSVYGQAGRGTFEMNGSADNILAMRIGGGLAGYLYTNSSNMELYSTTNIQFSTAGQIRATLSSAGNLILTNGVASDNGARLQVSGAATFSSSVTSGDLISTSYGTARIQIISTANNTNAALRFTAKDSGGTSKNSGLYYVSGTNTSNTFLSLSADDNNYQFNVLASGNVGIGTASPVTLLHLNQASSTIAITLQTGSNFGYLFNDGTNIGLASNVGSTGLKFLVNRSAPDNSLIITSGGNVLIGTTTDVGDRVNVNGSIRVPQTFFFRYDGDTGIFGSATSITGGSASQLGIRAASDILFATNGANERMRITSGGEVLIGNTDNGAYNLQCNGTGVWGAGAYVNGSDRNIKDNIATIEKGLEYIQKMNPVKFRYKPNYTRDHSMQTGFIAQELQEVFASEDYLSGLVQQGLHLSVAYQNLLPVLVKAIQELKQEIDTLKN